MNDFAVATQPETVRIERTLPGPIERVWAYLTEPEKRATWFAGGDFELRAGGKAELRFNHADLSADKVPPEKYRGMKKNFVMESAIIECVAPRLLVFTMKMGDDNTEVTFELAPRGKDTHLVVTHRRLGNRERMVNVSSGWDTHLGILADRLNGVEPRPFWTTHAKLEKEYAARL
jgi:uncharacterized protein YndB with AHSA1/START domain